MLRRDRDDAGAPVLEAVLVAALMMSSVAYVVTLDLPPGPTEGARGILHDRAADALAIMRDTPMTSTLGRDLLSTSLHECLQNDCSRLRASLDRLLPVGSGYSVHLSTREGVYDVYSTGSPRGEAVTARWTIEPAWSYQFLGLSQSVYDPLEDPVVVYGLPVHSGGSVHQGGSALRITLEGTRADHATFVLRGAASTRAAEADAGPMPPAVSLYFHTGDGVALASRDVRSWTLDVLRQPTRAPVPFHLRLHETGGGVVPAGTRLEVHLPAGWTATAQLPENAARWAWNADATNRSGVAALSTVVATLRENVSASHVDLLLHATYHGHSTDRAIFAAALSLGAYAQAQLVVRADDHLVTPAFEMPMVAASVPRPMGLGATTTWTLAATSPSPATITRAVIEEEDGREIFASVAPLAGVGSWSNEGHRLVWTGSVGLDEDTPLALAFAVTSSASGGPQADRAPFLPRVQVADHSGRLIEQTAPGMYRGVFLPAQPGYSGYDPATGGALRAEHEILSTAVYGTTALPGSAAYSVGPVLGLRDSVHGSAIAPVRRTSTPGGTVELDLDVQSVMYELAALGLTPSIDLYVYPPWAGNDRTPILQRDVYNGTLAAGGGSFLSVIDTDGDLLPDPTSVGRHRVDLAVPRGWLYGPYVVEARVSWIERVTGLVGGSPVTEDIVRSASVYDMFEVKPERDPLPPSPLYDVHLVAWLEDWA